MRRMISEKAQKYIKDLATNHPDPSASWGGSGSDYTAGDGIDITDGEISVDYGTGLTVSDETLIVDTTTIATKSELFSGDYDDLTNKPTIPTDTSDLTNGAGFITGITSTDVTTALGYTPGTSNFSGDYDDLTDKPTIPDAVSGTNDGTNWTNLTIGSDTYAIPQGGGSSYTFTNGLTESSGTVSWDLNDYMTKNSTSNYSALFIGGYPGAFNKDFPIVMGPYYNSTQADIDTITNKQTGKGININAHNWSSKANLLGGTGIVIGSGNLMGTNSNQSGQLMVGKGLTTNSYTADGAITLGQYNESNSNAFLIVGNGTSENARSNAMTVDNSGNMVLAGSITANNIVSQATSTSTVTPSTVQLTFTYSDNTTETITLMTGASVSTTTTLS